MVRFYLRTFKSHSAVGSYTETSGAVGKQGSNVMLTILPSDEITGQGKQKALTSLLMGASMSVTIITLFIFTYVAKLTKMELDESYWMKVTG